MSYTVQSIKIKVFFPPVSPDKKDAIIKIGYFGITSNKEMKIFWR